MERSHHHLVRRRPSARLAGAARLGLACTLALGSIVGVGAGSFAAQDAASLPESAALVPDDALLYLSTDLQIDNDQWAQTQALITSLGYPDALPDLRAAILEEAGIASDGDLPADDPLFGGELAVVVSDEAVARTIEAFEAMGGMGAMTGMGGMAAVEIDEPTASPAADAASPVAAEDAPALGVTGIFLPGDADAAWETIQDLKAEMGNSGEIVEVDYEGVTIEYQAADDESGMGTDTGTALARLDDAILVGGSPADLEPIIDVANGDADPIAGLAELGDVRGQLAEEALLFAYINGDQIGEALPPEAVDALLASTPQYADLGDALFEFDAGLTLSADEPGFRLDTVALYPEDSPLLELISENTNLSGDQRVPGDTFLFAAGSDLGPSGALSGAAVAIAQAVNQTFGDAAGTPTAMPSDPFATMDPAYVEDQFEDAEEILGFDIRADFFDRFVGEFALGFSLPSFTAGGLDFNGVFASGVDDQATVADSLTRIARLVDTAAAEDESSGIDITTRDLDGDRIYVVQDPENPELFSAEFGVVGEDVVFGVGSGLDSYANGPESSLADEARYQAVMATLPADNYQAVYLDIAQVVTLLETTGVVPGTAGGTTTDADPACADYDSQADAQDAYDADPFAESALDQDFDGDACEDFFVAATPEASPAAAAGSLDALQALASVSYRTDDPGVVGSSTILFIGELEADS